MKKNILIIGLVFVVVGIVLLAFAGLPQTFSYEQESGSDKVEAGYHYYYMFDVPTGRRLEFSFSSNSAVDFLVMDSENYEKAVAGKSFVTIYEQLDTNQASFAFETPKADKFYFVIDNTGPGSASWTYTHAVSYGRFSPVSWAGTGLIPVGAVIAFLGVILKPKIPPRLLDLVKTRGRIKIDQLAQELGTTEARVETGVYELMRAGHPIRFEAETREVVYG